MAVDGSSSRAPSTASDIVALAFTLRICAFSFASCGSRLRDLCIQLDLLVLRAVLLLCAEIPASYGIANIHRNHR